MTRRSKPESNEKEERLQKAITAFQTGQKTASNAIRDFDVPRKTFYRRLSGGLPRNKAHENEQFLTNAEEQELVRWITDLSKAGFAPRHATVREMAQWIHNRRVPSSAVNGINLNTVGSQWLPRFLGRHSELSSVVSNKIDAQRVKGTDPARLRKWFDDLRRVMDEYKIEPQNIYNMDESGFSIGEIEASKVIINAETRQKFQAKWNRQEWVTSIECICADGSSLPPLLIFKAKNLSRAWIPASIHNNWAFSCNENGWTSNSHGSEWLQKWFDPKTREKADGKYRLLICDGHDSHITGSFVGYCYDNKILLLILPAHSSHRTQPLDVGVFGPLKRIMASKLEPLLQTRIARLDKAEWAGCFAAAHNDAFTVQNIKSGFRATGIYPFLPSKLLHQTPTPEPEPVDLAVSSPIPTIPFPTTVLTSSPMDLGAIHTANSTLSSIIHDQPTIESPAKKYFDCLVRTSNRLWAKNAILTKEKDAMEAVLTARRARLSGKRKVIGDDSLITTAEKLRGIMEAEVRTRESRAKKRKVEKRKPRKARDMSTEESEMELEDVEDVSVEVGDCIVVRR
jgi:DDE superfamily endonuclease/Tc5 transposase DNA-binding domain/helix-turn-helix, Psq domain